MRKSVYLFFLYILFLFPNTMFGQDFWERINVPDSVYIRCFTTTSDGIMYFGSGNAGMQGGLYRSTDDGSTWDLLYHSGDFSVNSVIINDSGTIFMGTTRGSSGFYYSQDSGETWNIIPTLPSTFGRAYGIWTAEENAVYVCLQNSFNYPILARTSDFGTTWDSLLCIPQTEGNISDLIQIDSETLIISTTGYFEGSGGVYTSCNSGESWELSGLLNQMVRDIDTTTNGDLIAGSWGVTAYNIYPGLFIKRKEQNNWEQLISGYNVTSYLCTKQDHIYFEKLYLRGIYCSTDYGKSFHLQMEGYPEHNGGEKIMLAKDGHIYSYKSRLVRSVNPTGVCIMNNKTQVKNQITYSPNPVRDILKLENITEEMEYVIRSLSSLIVQSGKTENHSINVSGLNDGIYLIEIRKDAITHSVIKIVKV